MKIKFLLTGIIVCFLISGCEKQTKLQNPKISVLEGSYAIDVDSYSALAGDADYVIIGKVVDELVTNYKWPVMIENEDGTEREVTLPYTDYSIEVIKNLKGKLSQDAPITITKVGGLTKDGTTYIIHENDMLPSVNKTYIFYIYAQNDGSNLVAGTNSTIPLDDEGKSSESILEQVIEGVENQIVTERERSVSNDDVSVKTNP